MPDAWLVCAEIEVVIAPLDSQDISSPDVELPFRENPDVMASCCYHVLRARGTFTTLVGKRSEGRFHVHV